MEGEASEQAPKLLNEAVSSLGEGRGGLMEANEDVEAFPLL